MTPERALEIYQAGSQWCNWSEKCTIEEDRYVRKLWSSMPGHTCWHDALVRIINGETPTDCKCCKDTKKIYNAGQWISCVMCNVQKIEKGTRNG